MDERGTTTGNEPREGAPSPAAAPAWVLRYEPDETIDLFDLAEALRRSWFVPILLAVAAGALAFLGSGVRYESSAVYHIHPEEEGNTVPSYGEFFGNRSALESAVAELREKADYAEVTMQAVRSGLRLRQESGALTITYAGHSPLRAQQIVEAICRAGMSRLTAIHETHVERQILTAETKLTKTIARQNALQGGLEELSRHFQGDGITLHGTGVQIDEKSLPAAPIFIDTIKQIEEAKLQRTNLEMELRELKSQLDNIGKWLPLSVLDEPSIPTEPVPEGNLRLLVASAAAAGGVLGVLLVLFRYAYGQALLHHQRRTRAATP